MTTEFNTYAWPRGTRCASVRWGNVWRSRGSVAETWEAAVKAGDPLPVPDARLTAFLITLPQAADFALHALARMQGGEVFVPELPAARMLDLAQAFEPDHPVKLVGWRAGGEKLAERLLGSEEVRRTLRTPDGYLVQPSARTWSRGPYRGEPVDGEGFEYRSDQEDTLMDQEETREWMRQAESV